MKLKTLLAISSLILLLCTRVSATPPNVVKPNIIYILTDDLGIGNVTCYGADNYRTPHVDKLAAERTRVTHFYTAPLCGPSRALVMTGRYAFRTGATNQDATDLVPTFSELAGVTLPTDRQLDGRSFAPQLRGERGSPRDYAFMQLARDWWVRRDGWKLNQEGELLDMSRAPFEETLIATDADSEASKAARTNLASALAKLNPAGGILDDGDGTGRHASKSKKGKKESDGSKRMP